MGTGGKDSEKSRADRTELVELVTQTRAETGKWTETQYLTVT